MFAFRKAVCLAAFADVLQSCAAAPQLSFSKVTSDILAAARLVAPIEPQVRGSSGAHAQMVFLPPFTDTAVFIDNYHPNFGDGIDLKTGAHAKLPFRDPKTGLFIFGTEYKLTSNKIRPLHPISNTFCSAGAFFPNGTMFNTGGAEPARADGGSGNGPIKDGFDKIRTYKAGPCPASGCVQDWVETGGTIQRKRWYHSMQTLTDGSILMVGGAKAGGLVYNEPKINEASFEIARLDGRIEPVVDFPFLAFTDNDGPGKSYNLYPILHLLPNKLGRNLIFTLAGNRAMIFDYKKNVRVKELSGVIGDINNIRTFPASAMSVILPLTPANRYTPKILVCGGSTGDRPEPVALKSCGTMEPYKRDAQWELDEMPSGRRVMGDMILLPSGEVFIVNGASVGSGGGFMAEQPVTKPLIYNPNKPLGQRFNVNLTGSPIPRMYHSVATLLPSGEVMVAGSNPAVFYAPIGSVPGGGK